MTYRWVSFTTDYGTLDGFVATVKGVIAGIAADVTVIDVTHQVPAQDVRRGAAVLAQTAPWLPPAVHLAVVDPGVGTQRRGIAVVAARGVLVGPDNGLLLPAADALGGMRAAYELTDPAYRLAAVSATFHGRDVFAPVAAALACGAPLAEAGDPLDASELAALALPRPRREGDQLIAHALMIDVYGNVTLDVRHDDLPGTGLALGHSLEVSARGLTHPATFTGTFADVPAGELLVYEDASRMLALAVNRGDAATTLAIAPDSEVRLAPL